MKVLYGLLFIIVSVKGHARLIEPPSRSSMWRYGFDNPADYQDNEGFCGGFKHQWDDLDGKCGICGDAFDADPKDHEAPGGRFANGIIVKEYKSGDKMKVSVEVTANHKGFFTFKLCPNNNIHQDPTQECFDKHHLNLASGEVNFTVPDEGSKTFEMELELPEELSCDQCILQWTYRAGNNWGVDPDGTGCVGCGHQEHFRACADIKIIGTTDPSTMSPFNPVTTKKPKPSTTKAPKPTATVKPPTTTHKGHKACKSVPPYNGANMDTWCDQNCNAIYPNCPEDHCKCQ